MCITCSQSSNYLYIYVAICGQILIKKPCRVEKQSEDGWILKWTVFSVVSRGEANMPA